MSREIMQQALDKFEHLWEIGIDAEYKVDLMPEICALRVELAKPEQEQEPESHIVKWSIPVDPNNFGEPLAQPEQEPVCDKDPYLCGFVQCQLGKACKNTLINTIPTKIFGPNLEQILNAAGFYKRQWVGLTDEEIKEVLDLNVAPWSLSGVALQHVMDDARALEAKLKEKNGG